MSSILDIDLDYFCLVPNPARRLERLLRWGGQPVAFVVNQHHQAFVRWRERVRKGTLAAPSHILHVDEHHDMMDAGSKLNLANFMYHAMATWRRCRVHWLAERPIDSPEMWLDEDAWRALSRRFSAAPRRPRGWPKPDLVSVCTSPEFVRTDLRECLLDVINQWMRRQTGSGVLNLVWSPIPLS